MSQETLYCGRCGGREQVVETPVGPLCRWCYPAFKAGKMVPTEVDYTVIARKLNELRDKLYQSKSEQAKTAVGNALRADPELVCLTEGRIEEFDVKRIVDTDLAVGLARDLGYELGPGRIARIVADVEVIQKEIPEAPASWVFANALYLEIDMYGDPNYTGPGIKGFADTDIGVVSGSPKPETRRTLDCGCLSVLVKRGNPGESKDEWKDLHRVGSCKRRERRVLARPYESIADLAGPEDNPDD